MSDDFRVSLDALVRDASAVSELSPEQAAALLGALSNIQSLIVARLAMVPASANAEPGACLDPEGNSQLKLLTAEQDRPLAASVQSLADDDQPTSRITTPTALALEAPVRSWGPDDLVTVGEAAGLLRVSPRWLYRHAKTLPFTRKLSRKVLRFSQAGITRWLASKRP